MVNLHCLRTVIKKVAEIFPETSLISGSEQAAIDKIALKQGAFKLLSLSKEDGQGSVPKTLTKDAQPSGEPL